MAGTVEQLLQWLRDAGVSDSAPIVIQAYGKAAKCRDWTVDVVGGEVVICADLAPRRRPGVTACPVCGGTEFESAIDNHGDAYSGCVRCALKANDSSPR